MSFSTDLREELLSLKVWDTNSSLAQDEQLARLYIREAFIKAGFINEPQKEYHLEIRFKTKEKAEKLKSILSAFGISSKIIKKANENMVYLKDGEDISNFLAICRS